MVDVVKYYTYQEAACSDNATIMDIIQDEQKACKVVIEAFVD